MTSDEYRAIVELLSLAFTAPLLVLGLLVIAEAIPAILNTEKYSPIWWMLLGIAIGFAGSWLDNFYWGWPWSFHYLGMPIGQTLNENGVYNNLLFRQGFGVIAAYCHLRAFIAPEKAGGNRNRLMRIVHWFFGCSLLVGFAYILMLYFIKQKII